VERPYVPMMPSPYPNDGRELYERWKTGEISRNQLGDPLYQFWSRAHDPLQFLQDREWLELFRAAAPLRMPTNLPALPISLILYRGSSRDYARRMPWSTDLDIARMHMKKTRDQHGVPAFVFCTVIPAAQVLAFFNVKPLCEHEVIVDPASLRAISEAENCG
jgi:hypothetical protein